MAKTIIIKLTGELIEQTEHGLSAKHLVNIAHQIKSLTKTHVISIVIGGGNFFRGSKHSSQVAVSPQTGHTVGMLATMMNGLIVQDILEQAGITTKLFTALECNSVGATPSIQAIRLAKKDGLCMIFSGGTGDPFFTTDTAAVVRALQINATEIWKGTKTDGVFSSDPNENPSAKKLQHLTYKQAMDAHLRIMDRTAFALAEPHKIVVRIFNIFADNALIKVAQDSTFGSTIASAVT